MARRTIILIVFLGASAFMLFMAYRIFSIIHADAPRYNEIANAQTARTEGEVTAVLRNNYNRNGKLASQTVKIAFAAANEEEFNFEARLIGNHAKVGMKVPIRYDPYNPNSSDIVREVEPSHVFVFAYLLTLRSAQRL